MITGHIQEKKGRLYMVLNLKNESGKWKPKWISTGLAVKGNIKRAESMLRATLTEYQEKHNALLADSCDSKYILFSDFMKSWLNMVKSSLEETTYTSYRMVINKSVYPYFKSRGFSLRDIEENPQYIQAYYTYLMNERGLKATSVHRHHANIRKALQYAVKTNMIATNPADKIDKPKAQHFIVSYYSDQQLNELFEKSKDSKLHLVILIAAYYGLRRSEVLGLKWNAIDFENKTITIRHTVTSAYDEKTEETLLVCKDRGKNLSSYRSLPLLDEIEKVLLKKREADSEFKRIFGRSYSKEYAEYIFVDESGELIKPNYVTSGFANLLKSKELERIRFHDLRHSCASLLLKNRVNMKAIQEWLGHSNYNTTANIYAHLDVNSKIDSGKIVAAAFNTQKNS